MLEGFGRRCKPLELLTPEEVEAIHRGALYVLAKTGLRVEHERALRLCADHGCQVDFDERRVRMPPGLVEECIGQCPSSYVLKARDRDLDLMHEELKFRFPVYLMVSKTDLVEGFVDFFRRIPAQRRDEIFGWSDEQPGEREPARLVGHGFGRLASRLSRIRLEMLAAATMPMATAWPCCIWKSETVSKA